MKRSLDVLVSAIGLALGSAILVPAMIAVWLQDWHSPFYIAPRAARRGGTFRMVKLRSMRILADSTGVVSTAGDDPRITRVGKLIRKLKLDEFTQLWNVLAGDMSLVGPRPQVMVDVARYTDEERQLLTVRPGITDMASIVFADEGDILRGSGNPDLLYNQVIRPWKSRLGLLYVRHGGALALDIRLVCLTLLNAIDRPAALRCVSRTVRRLGGDERLARVALRDSGLEFAPPPGAANVVESI
jgi:lipopolysaccharide/colanic/teichoic acid biosynthesis glycosyltransferase